MALAILSAIPSFASEIKVTVIAFAPQDAYLQCQMMEYVKKSVLMKTATWEELIVLDIAPGTVAQVC